MVLAYAPGSMRPGRRPWRRTAAGMRRGSGTGRTGTASGRRLPGPAAAVAVGKLSKRLHARRTEGLRIGAIVGPASLLHWAGGVRILPSVGGRHPVPVTAAPITAPCAVRRGVGAIGMFPFTVRPDRKSQSPGLYDVRAVGVAARADGDQVVPVAAFLIGVVVSQVGRLLGTILGDSLAGHRRMRVGGAKENPTSLFRPSAAGRQGGQGRDPNKVLSHGCSSIAA